MHFHHRKGFSKLEKFCSILTLKACWSGTRKRCLVEKCQIGSTAQERTIKSVWLWDKKKRVLVANTYPISISPLRGVPADDGMIMSKDVSFLACFKGVMRRPSNCHWNAKQHFDLILRDWKKCRKWLQSTSGAYKQGVQVSGVLLHSLHNSASSPPWGV